MTRVLYLHDFLIYFLSVYEKWPEICISFPGISVLHPVREGVERETEPLHLRSWSLVRWFVAHLPRWREASETQASKGLLSPSTPHPSTLHLSHLSTPTPPSPSSGRNRAQQGISMATFLCNRDAHLLELRF